MDDKTKSIVAHLTFIGWIIALVTTKLIKDQILPFISVKIWDYGLLQLPAL